MGISYTLASGASTSPGSPAWTGQGLSCWSSPSSLHCERKQPSSKQGRAAGAGQVAELPGGPSHPHPAREAPPQELLGAGSHPGLGVLQEVLCFTRVVGGRIREGWLETLSLA